MSDQHATRTRLRSKKQATLALGLVAVLLIAPLALAGTATNPNIVDPANDGFDHLAGVPNLNGRLDILGAWIGGVSDDDMEIGLVVRDYIAPTDDGAFNDGTVAHSWSVEFESQGHTLVMRAHQDDEGDHLAFLIGLPSTTYQGDGNPSTYKRAECSSEPTATLEFDANADTIVFTFPRQFTIRTGTPCADTPGIEEHDFDFTDTTAITNMVASAGECVGDAVVEPDAVANQISCVTNTIDMTTPAFLSHPAAPDGNPHLFIRPTESVLSAAPGSSTPGSVLVSNPEEVLLETVVSVNPPAGWTATPASHSVSLEPGQTEELLFEFAAEPSAASGVAVLHGAGVPTEILLVAADLALGTATRPDLPIIGESPAEEAALYLYAAATVNTDRDGGISGDLIAEAPFPDASETITRDIEGITPFGIWTSEELKGHIYLSETANLEVPITWSEAEGMELTALLGADLPLDWDGKEELTGVARLDTTLDGTAEGDFLVEFTGSTSGLFVSPSEDLEVGIYANAPSGSATMTVFDQEQPATLEFGYSVPILSSAIRTLAGDGEGDYMATMVEGAGLPEHRAGTDASLGLDAATTKDTSSGPVDLVYESISGLTETERETITFNDGETEPRLIEFPVTGQGMTINLDGADDATGNIWVEVRAVRNNGNVEPFAIDRSPGIDKDILIAPIGPGLADVGRLQVYLVPRGISATDVVVTAEAAEELRVPNALNVHNAIIESVTKTDGEGVMTLTAEGRTARTVPVHYTADGPTIQPIAHFIPSAPAIHAGSSVTFIDHSHDPEGDLAAWSWDFGDGATSVETNPTHQFTEPGSYPVTLTVTDGHGVASESRVVTMTVVPPGEPLPQFTAPPVGTAIPARGTLGYYANAYAVGSAHIEDYHSGWAKSELRGLIGVPYMASGDGPQAYAFGSITDVEPDLEWTNDGFTFTNHVGASVQAVGGSVSQSIGAATVTAASDGNAFPEDSGKDGHVQSTSSDGRTLSILQGTIHTDIRSSSSESVTTFTAPATSWLAYQSGFGVKAMPVADANGLTVTAKEGNQWFAVYDPASTEVIGAVLSGDLQGADLAWTDGTLTVTGSHGADAAQYLTAYTVADTEGTRYAGVKELARMDAQELGIAYLTGSTAAAMPWAGAEGTTIDAGDDPSFSMKAFIGQQPEWTVDVQTEDTDKPLRVILPSQYTEEDEGASAQNGDSDEADAPRDEFRDEDTYTATFDVDGSNAAAQPMQFGAPGLLFPLVLVWGVFLGILLLLLLPALSLTKKMKQG